MQDRDLVLDAIEDAQRILAEPHRAGLLSESRDHHQYASISAGPARSRRCGQTAPRWVWAARREMIPRMKNARRPWEPEEEKQLRKWWKPEKR